MKLNMICIKIAQQIKSPKLNVLRLLRFFKGFVKNARFSNPFSGPARLRDKTPVTISARVRDVLISTVTSVSEHETILNQNQQHARCSMAPRTNNTVNQYHAQLSLGQEHIQGGPKKLHTAFFVITMPTLNHFS